jgi:uncharacterized protein YbbC (DUF1343 family)
MASAILIASCTPATHVPPAQPATQAEVRPGLEVFLENPPAWIAGQRLGLITNHAGIDRRGNSNIDLLAARSDMRLVALFAFEHGIRGDAPAGQRIASGMDERTGLPIHSLYGDTYKPTPEMLRDVDVLLYDVQDSGARPYTRVSTMALSMQAAAEKGIPFVVLDRPNPLGGEMIEGNLLDPAFASFVGMYPIPMRHGMTLGELARMYNREYGINANLTVLPMQGWARSMWFDQTGLPWVPPSPNIRRLEAAILYPGTVLIEGTNLSEGRGTDRPFEHTGAPWLRAPDVADSMNAMRLPGVRFEPVRLTIDSEARKYPGQTVPGVRFLVTDREVYEPVATAVRLIDLVRRLHPEHFEWRGANQREPNMLSIDRLAGTDRLRHAIESGTLQQLLAEWERDEQRFRETRRPYLLYQ